MDGRNGKLISSVAKKMTINGTFTGPDAMAQRVAPQRHCLGAAKATSLNIVSDGAVWVWNRIDHILAPAGIPEIRPNSSSRSQLPQTMGTTDYGDNRLWGQ